MDAGQVLHPLSSSASSAAQLALGQVIPPHAWVIARFFGTHSCCCGVGRLEIKGTAQRQQHCSSMSGLDPTAGALPGTALGHSGSDVALAQRCWHLAASRRCSGEHAAAVWLPGGRQRAALD